MGAWWCGLDCGCEHICWLILNIYTLWWFSFGCFCVRFICLFLLLLLCGFYERVDTVISLNAMSKIFCILFVPCSRKTRGRSRTWRQSTGSRRWCRTAMWPSANLPSAAPLPSSVSTCPSTLSEPRSVDTLCKLIGRCRGTYIYLNVLHVSLCCAV